MKTSRYFDSQILSILKQDESGMAMPAPFAGNCGNQPVFVERQFVHEDDGWSIPIREEEHATL